jgi:hypothetical protein
MTHTITINNGSGWNNYPALRELKNLPLGTKGLMRANGCTLLEIGPADPEKPLGIAARYYDASGDLLFTQRFDQNDSAGWIRSAVTALLTKTIAVRREERGAEIAAEDLKRAQRAGFATAAEHRADIERRTTEAQAAAKAASDARAAWLSGENGGSDAASDALESMRSLRAQQPAANTITRKGNLAILRTAADGLTLSAGCGMAEIFQEKFNDLEGMKAWLIQHGHRASVDDRQFFFDAAK